MKQSFKRGLFNAKILQYCLNVMLLRHPWRILVQISYLPSDSHGNHPADYQRAVL